MSGQTVKRAERIEEYQNWSGAQLVEPNGSVKAASTDANPQIVQQELTAIRGMLKTAGLKVHCDISHAPTVAAIKEALTPEERLRVKFGDAQ